ncbi:hypothetical protein ACU8KH_00371 [Lachancea thermotolerans]
MFWLILLVAAGLTAVCSFLSVNRYLSFKLHKNTLPFTLATLLVNMWILLAITYLLPLDVFYAARASGDDSNAGLNGTAVAQPTPHLLARGLKSVRELAGDTSEGNESYAPDFSALWYGIYWLEFFICWFVLPVLISYLDLKYLFPTQLYVSQRKTIFQRVKKAVTVNIKFYALCALGLLGGVLYLVFGTNRGIVDLKPLIISFSHLYSLSYTLILLSMGLILLPKALLTNRTDENKLFVDLSKSNDESNDAKMAMTDYAGKILSIREVNNGDVALAQAINECKLEVQSLVNETQISLPHLPNGDQHINLDKINKYYNGFKKEYYNYLYYQAKSDRVIHDLAQSQVKTISATKSVVRMVFGICCLLLSILVVFLEFTPSKFAHSKLFQGTSWFNFLLEISILVYNTFASLYAMTCFKWQNLHLIPNGQSSPKNALYYSLYSSRLLLPLCFNFMALISHDPGAPECSFEKVLYKDLKLIPLVDILNRYLPVFFIIAVPVGYFLDLKNRVLVRVLGKEYCYELFGILTDPAPQSDSSAQPSHEASQAIDRSRLDEDYEYSLQDGRYLFQRATSNYNLREDSADSDRRAYV